MMLSTEKFAAQIDLPISSVREIRRWAGLGTKIGHGRGWRGPIMWDAGFVDAVHMLVGRGLPLVTAARVAAMGKWNGRQLIITE